MFLAFTTQSGANNYKTRYNFSFDYPLTFNTGADLTLSGIQYLQNKEENLNFIMKILLGIPSGYFLALMNHEISGHMIRCLENNVKIHGLHLHGLGAAVSHGIPHNRIENMIISLGGNEANYVLSEKIKKRYFENQMKITNVFGAAYLFSSGNQFYYTSLSSKEFYDNSGHDIKSYIENINKYYKDSNFLTREKVLQLGFVDLLDPFLVFSIYSAITGKEVTIPTIKFADIGYLPSFRTVLSPYGTEIRMMNHLYYDDKYYQLNLNYGNNKDKISYMVQLNAEKLYENNNFFIGANLAFWQQPELFIDVEAQKKQLDGRDEVWGEPPNSTKKNDSLQQHLDDNPKFNGNNAKVDSLQQHLDDNPKFNGNNAKVALGGKGVIILGFKISENLILNAEFGYKTAGYLAGDVLKSTFIARLGIQSILW